MDWISWLLIVLMFSLLLLAIEKVDEKTKEDIQSLKKEIEELKKSKEKV